MNNQKCPACGAALENHMTVCPDCGLDGLDQFFLSKEAYLDWYEREVIPQQDRIRKPQFFAGARHFLILLGSGDLYAVGHNGSDACGVDLPRKLTEPVRIARNVKHAAAGENHTVYITQDKEVKIIGNSDLADRFRCDLRAEYVFSNGSDIFYLEDENRVWYVFGNNAGEKIAPRTRECLRDFEKYTVRTMDYGTWKRTWTYGTVSHEGYSAIGSKSDHTNERLDNVRRSNWYVEQVRMYGEKNIMAEDVLLNKDRHLLKDLHVESCGEPPEYWRRNSGREVRHQEYEEIHERQIQVYLENRMIYEPVPCRVKVDANRPYRYFGGKGFPVEHAETVLQGYQKQYFGRDWYWQDIVSLYETGDILFLERRRTEVPTMLYPSIGRAIDFAWSAHSGGTIVATRDGEILWGDPSNGVEGLERFRICENVSWKL